MGTRGSICFVANGEEKITYMQYDSYPDGVGETVLKWLTAQLSAGREATVKQKVLTLRPVDESSEPTVLERAKYAEFLDEHVSTGRDWYSLLRHCQGEPSLILQAGVFCDASYFPFDSLFCEWAYVVDLDERVFEVYQGFRTSPPTQGRWAGRPNENKDNNYRAVQRIARYSFNELPENLLGVEKSEE